MPSSASAARMAAATPAGSVMSWTQSNVVTRSSGPVGGERGRPRVEEGGVGDARLRLALTGLVEGVVADVVAGDLRGGEHRCQQQDEAAGAAADVGDAGAGLEPGQHPVERGEHRGHQVGAHPRLEPAGHACGALRSVLVIGQADAGAEGVGEPLEGRHGLREVVEAPRPEGGVVGRGQQGDRFRGEREQLVAVDLDQAGRALVVRPLPHPALVELAARGEGAGAERVAGVGQRPVQAQAIAEVDHARRDGALQLREQQEGELPEPVRVDGGRRALAQALGSQPARSSRRGSFENISVMGWMTPMRFCSRLMWSSSFQIDRLTAMPCSPARAVRPERCR